MPDIVSIQSTGVILFIVTSLFGDISQTIWWVLIGNIWKLASGVKLIVEMLTNYRAKVDKLSSAKISQNPRRMSTSWKFIISQIGLSLGQGHVEGWAIREIPLGNSRLCLGEKESQKKKKRKKEKKKKKKENLVGSEEQDLWRRRKNKGLEEKRPRQRRAGATWTPLGSLSIQQKPCCSRSSHFISLWISAPDLEGARPIVPSLRVTAVRHRQVKQPAQHHISGRGSLRDVSPHSLVSSSSFLCKKEAGLHCNVQITQTPLSLKLFDN